MCRQTMAVLLHISSGFPTKRLEQMIVTSLYDVTRVSHATEGGTIKGEHDQASGLLLLSSRCLTQVFGSLASHRPSTLAVSVPLE